ncbi:hypothetical protein LDI01_22980 [Lentilactobacillus diolivorans]|uniref:Uncharacterized protein n=1 Tax=Lentilactobacillus diolivorans TaxID=179838 RepID=A0ABQ0XMP6_9LACO|nr:hypothetical protein LDI01_22980 [Lentilactobacillus diolivorans]
MNDDETKQKVNNSQCDHWRGDRATGGRQPFSVSPSFSPDKPAAINPGSESLDNTGSICSWLGSWFTFPNATSQEGN